MAKSYRPYCPDEELLLPPSLRDWLPEKHLAYFVSDVVLICASALDFVDFLDFWDIKETASYVLATLQGIQLVNTMLNRDQSSSCSLNLDSYRYELCHRSSKPSG